MSHPLRVTTQPESCLKSQAMMQESSCNIWSSGDHLWPKPQFWSSHAFDRHVFLNPIAFRHISVVGPGHASGWDLTSAVVQIAWNLCESLKRQRCSLVCLPENGRFGIKTVGDQQDWLGKRALCEYSQRIRSGANSNLERNVTHRLVDLRKISLLRT